MGFVTEKIKKSLSGTNYVVILGFVGVLLLSLGEIFPENKTTNTTKYSVEDYKNETEQQLEAILSSIDGAGDVKVMLTLESGEEKIYVHQEKTSADGQSTTKENNRQNSYRNSYENEIVMIEENNQKQALVEKVIQPVVKGVVVVCSGAEDVSVVSDITNAVCVALNITSNRVCVIKMK